MTDNCFFHPPRDLAIPSTVTDQVAIPIGKCDLRKIYVVDRFVPKQFSDHANELRQPALLNQDRIVYHKSCRRPRYSPLEAPYLGLRVPIKTGHGRALKQMRAQPRVRNASWISARRS